MRWVPAVVACTGCSSILGIDDFKLTDGGTNGEMPMTDGPPIDAPSNCLGADRFIVCLNPLPTTELIITTGSTININTDTDNRCLSQQPMGWTAQGQPAACFLVGTRINISQVVVTATGTRPLVFAATDSITLAPAPVGGASAIDVAGRRGPVRAPGAPSVLCMPPSAAQNGNPAIAPGTGGAGGAFITVGGRGGDTAGLQGGQSGAAVGPPPTLRAGCNGGVGGLGDNNAPFGNGGGAVFLVAGNRIDIGAPINASGSGATGGDGGGGGGGGAGSGGMIVLYAPAINGMTGATLVANGGGGGGGGDLNGASAVAGADPNPSSPTQPASGGGGPTPGGAGYPGTNGVAGNGVPGTNIRAGGGGGGGAGYIRSNRALTIPASPPVTVVP